MTAVGTDFERHWQAWHDQRETRLRDPLGVLSWIGLHWLDTDEQPVPGVPGRWRADGDTVVVTVDRLGELARDGRPLADSTVLRPAEGAPGLELTAGTRIAEVVRRTGKFAVRVHDPAAPALAHFAGIPAYRPDPRWAVLGFFEPYERSRTITTAAVLDGLEHRHAAAGTVVFRLDGAEYRLIAFGRPETGLSVLFTDATSGVTTYPAARRLELGTPAVDGGLTVDFNRALNLPCAFTDHATCPLAPAENRLPVAIEAGEQNPRTRAARTEYSR
ncbi:DUF1684 domain-containing protein [Nocardia stercoris]|uniref:DUF1684 domain-containing protein n=1 Tax=Nocardia stercoris TaxID=2483361 RepID=A0A3M2L9S5_9NOCA|nr:DUF1684 domain-containing protein [Nocardia stercoris]RMI31328.1 DUF1684 domain-containing protein [Nocardia stercoris]